MAVRNPLVTQAFALAGDRTLPPVTAQPDGSVSFNQGWGPDYQADPDTDPDAKPVERQITNAMLWMLTANLQQYQREGVPEFIAAADNGGVAVAYPMGVSVMWRALETDPWRVYKNIVANNTAVPGTVGSGWIEDKLGNLSGFASITTASGSLTREHVGQMLVLSASSQVGSYSLPPTENLSEGAKVQIYVTSGAVVILTSPSPNIFGTSVATGGVNSIRLIGSTYIELVWTGTYWLTTNNASYGNMQAFGYQQFANGLILQWGNANGLTSGSRTVAFPITFPNSVFQVVVTCQNVASYVGSLANVPTNSNFLLDCWTNAATPVRSTAAASWFAIGA